MSYHYMRVCMFVDVMNFKSTVDDNISGHLSLQCPNFCLYLYYAQGGGEYEYSCD